MTRDDSPVSTQHKPLERLRKIITWIAWRITLALSAFGLTCGCVSSSDVKLASTQMTTALKTMSDAEALFKQKLLAEIDATRNQVALAYVARMVKDKINRSAADVQAGNLLTVAADIDSARDGEQQFITSVMAITVLPADYSQRAPDTEKIVKDFIESETKRHRASLSSIRDPAIKQEVQSKIDALESHATDFEVLTLVRLAGMRSNVDKNLFGQLDTHVAVLKAIHQEVDTWVKTDVTVSGKDVADTLVNVDTAFHTNFAKGNP